MEPFAERVLNTRRGDRTGGHRGAMGGSQRVIKLPKGPRCWVRVVITPPIAQMAQLITVYVDQNL